jgi:glycosyltransferase involved in cell wall biosynthesis
MTTESSKQRNAIWSIGMYAGESPCALRPAQGSTNPVLTRDQVTDVPACFVADPFMIPVRGLWHMFFEVMNSRTGRGEIGWATSKDMLRWKYGRIVLREPFHLSYPCVFEWEGGYYMVPESHKAGGVRLYRATDFPQQWTFVGELLEGAFADTSLFRFNDAWWLFTFESTTPEDPGVLRLFSATQLAGTWLEHPRSPIVRADPRRARPAGRVLATVDRVIRYAQDCEAVYGNQVRAFEITRLTPTEYEEREVPGSPLLTPAGSGWNESGMHHVDAHALDANRWIACADGFAWEFKEEPQEADTSATPVAALKRRLRHSRAYSIASDVKASVKRHFAEAALIPIRLNPVGTPRGRLLFSYVTNAFTGQVVPYAHTGYWESRRMAETFADLGYAVDVISAGDAGEFRPEQEYAFFVGHRHNFDRIARLLPADCVKVLHCDVAHWLFHNTAGHKRALALQERRGVTLPVLRLQEPNSAIEHADCATVLGNEFTIATYRHANKPLYRVPISTPAIYPWPEGKDFNASRKHFLWFNSNGFVHKGLDLVLEAFASMPDYQLTVCGPIGDPVEKPFERAYFDELYRMPNIHVAGWVEDGSEEFVQIAGRCIGVISASCSEGGGGSVISCMHTGLIPVVSHETSVDTQSFGFVLRDCSIESIAESVRSLAGLPEEDLRGRARAAWEYARANHTREKFAEEYRKVALTIIQTAPRRVAHAEVAARNDGEPARRTSGQLIHSDRFSR